MAGVRLSPFLVLLLSLSKLCNSSISNNDTADPVNRIIGGEIVYQPVPYQISLQILRNNRWGHVCGGAIVSQDHILTAAHCVKGQDPYALSIVAGITSLSSRSGTRHFVAAPYIHENYTKFYQNDIAVVRVFPPFNLNKVTVDAIDFRNTAPVGGGVPLILTGWGSIYQSGSGPLPDQLRRFTTFTLSNDECRAYFSRLEKTGMCTLRSGGKGACSGDSGGPLVSFDMKTLFGLVSFGARTCASGSPDFYTRVSEYVPWILKKIALLDIK